MIETILFEAGMSAGQKTASTIGAKLITGFVGSVGSTLVSKSIAEKAVKGYEADLQNNKFASETEAKEALDKVSNSSMLKSAAATSVIGAAGVGLFKLAENLISKSN